MSPEHDSDSAASQLPKYDTETNHVKQKINGDAPLTYQRDGKSKAACTSKPCMSDRD